jgi:hypothetical protein
MLFYPNLFTSKQIPHSGPIPNPMFFSEFLTGSWYLDAGYEVLRNYREVEDHASFEVVCKLLGGREAADLVTPNAEKGGRPPDLIVFERNTGRFRFVECKRANPWESFTGAQPSRFSAVEACLNERLDWERYALTDATPTYLFPQLPQQRWIHVVRIAPVGYSLPKKARAGAA